MSVRTEWADAQFVSVEAYKPGGFEDSYGMTNDKHAIAFAGDEYLVIEGTPAELRKLFNRALSLLSKLPQ